MMIVFLLLLAGCAQKAPPPGAAGPAEAVQDFSAAVQRGDAAAAWALLSSRTQAEANELARAAHADAGDGRAMLFGSALPGGPVAIQDVQQDGGSAEVRTAAADGGDNRSFHVVRENERWRIDLPLRH